jgi:hypothetical protein
MTLNLDRKTCSFLLAIFILKAYFKVEPISEYTPYLNSSSIKLKG